MPGFDAEVDRGSGVGSQIEPCPFPAEIEHCGSVVVPAHSACFDDQRRRARIHDAQGGVIHRAAVHIEGDPVVVGGTGDAIKGLQLKIEFEFTSCRTCWHRDVTREPHPLVTRAVLAVASVAKEDAIAYLKRMDPKITAQEVNQIWANFKPGNAITDAGKGIAQRRSGRRPADKVMGYR